MRAVDPMRSVDSSFVSGVLHGRSIRSFVLGRVHAGLACVVALALMLFAGAVPAGTASIVRASAQQRNDAIQHTDPLNFDPVVREEMCIRDRGWLAWLRWR